MRHVSLYRKWRPRTFDAIVGQDPVVRTLRRAIQTDRVAHAYLFSGPRGTGKTSTAKVLAMGLNCVKGSTPDPDGTCESCHAIINNSSLDVLEMDAASNRGIDEIRDLRDKVNLAPAQGRVKVYIIDEVHMLTTEAFNALLKMLEEPPEHVVFVLATTEKHKVLPTIISRCQSFDFRRPGVALLSEKLREITEAEGIKAEPAALTLIAREGKGSFRDAESLLDQLASFAEGPITAVGVRELLGTVGSEVLLETVDALYERRAENALRVVDRLQNEGKDLSQFVGELLAHLRRLMLLPYAPEVALAEIGAEERPALEEQAGRIPATEVVRMIEALGDTLSRTRRGGDPKLELELTFLKLSRDYTEPQVDALMRRLEALEKAVAGESMVSSRDERWDEASLAPWPLEAMEGERTGTTIPGPAEPDMAEQEMRAETTDRVSRVADIAAAWGQIMQDLRHRKQVLTATVFQEGWPSSFDDEVLEVSFPQEPDFYLKEAKNPRHREALGEILEERFGMRPRLEFRGADTDGAARASGGATNGSDPSACRQPRQDIPEATYEVESPRETDAASAPTPKPEAKSMGGEAGGADDIIRDSREVLAMARKRFGTGDSGSNRSAESQV